MQPAPGLVFLVAHAADHDQRGVGRGRLTIDQALGPGCGLADPLFWGSLALGLGIAWLVAFPVNRWLLSRGQGHALVSAHHDGHH